MKFRPCIDIHNGKVKQIVGSSLRDEGDSAEENFVSGRDAAYYAKLYQKDGVTGGHVILLNPAGSAYYEETRRQALLALRAYPGGLSVGGGVHPGNAGEYLSAGAGHVVVTSYVFSGGRADFGRLQEMSAAVGKDRLILDVSCRKRDGAYYIVTDRWQKFTEEKITCELLDRLAAYADEFLVHAADAEGKSAGIEEELAKLLASWGKIPVTYAGGVGSFEDLERLKRVGKGRLDVTIGSALDLFGGPMAYRDVLAFVKEEQDEVYENARHRE